LTTFCQNESAPSIKSATRARAANEASAVVVIYLRD